ncbi:MAG TPA: beta-N-acetylglucosaminidase domain-containing protein [Candidatus Limnocylindrales bacterium]|nr:beta-N-acetylglucosaminidase domain-containing protein [Candidatus Limnocylindrales bacterium]
MDATRGFPFRGTKGWAWTSEQYLEEIPWLARMGLNVLMNCYISVCDVEHYPWGDPRANRWWEPLPEAKARAFEAIVAAARAAGLDFWFAMNPGLFTLRAPDPTDPADVEALASHYLRFQRAGVRTFALCFDDLAAGVDAVRHAALANALLDRLRRHDAEARLVVCPSWFWGDGRDPAARAYLELLGRRLDPEALVFWTGDAVVTPRVTRRAAESYRAIVGHRLVLWDNYPVNDDHPTMHLGPLVGRDPDLPAVVDGYLSNPMCRQSRLNRLPLWTCADYARDPPSYDPEASIRAAIERIAETAEERSLLGELVATYPGMLRYAESQYFNPVRARIEERLRAGDRVGAAATLERLAELTERFAGLLGSRFPAELETLRDDVAWARAALGA